MELRRIATTLELREVSGHEPRVGGYVVLFDTPTDPDYPLREMVSPGAFTKTLRERPDVRVLMNHDPSLLLGRSASGTLRLVQDNDGLSFEVDLPQTTYAADLRELMRRGDIGEMSFGFDVVKDDMVDGVRYLREVRLWEVSIVTMPAYTRTSAQLRAFAALLDGTPAEPVSDVPDVTDEPTVRSEPAPAGRLIRAASAEALRLAGSRQPGTRPTGTPAGPHVRGGGVTHARKAV